MVRFVWFNSTLMFASFNFCAYSSASSRRQSNSAVSIKAGGKPFRYVRCKGETYFGKLVLSVPFKYTFHISAELGAFQSGVS